MHEQAYAFVARHGADVGAVDVLEIGSHDVNGSVRPIFPTATQFHGIDIAAGSTGRTCSTTNSRNETISKIKTDARSLRPTRGSTPVTISARPPCQVSSTASC